MQKSSSFYSLGNSNRNGSYLHKQENQAQFFQSYKNLIRDRKATTIWWYSVVFNSYNEGVGSLSVKH